MAHTRLLYHIVSATYRREPTLRKDIRQRVYRYMSGICRNMECPLTIAGGIEDHVHLFAELRPTICVADFVRDVKACSSRFIHETFPEQRDFAWQASYAAFTVSPSVAADVRRYIENQEEHHRKLSFIDELKALYERHGLMFDPAEFDVEVGRA